MSKPTTRKTIANKVRIARIDSGKTQVQMAKHLNVARQTYLDMESGKTEPRVTALQRIATYTDFPLVWFFEETEDNMNYYQAIESQDLLDFMKEVAKLPATTRKEFLQSSKRLATSIISITQPASQETFNR
ncbi:helix-turn-helix domain-containing protein [Grimontia kaedaensis]|uniref:Helix-turn-helix domain-containing protein n=1 Tax=Grimontia kaedaensis TaxID=2872157 RepID=A0ABY4X0W1_9GAMM|nr:helix-turn-helix transcriptional regulator [Grimontia kaedaensis]USH04843.1 helix-turn-helix domain-containing protein [Grimontia kaedaensis]